MEKETSTLSSRAHHLEVAGAKSKLEVLREAAQGPHVQNAGGAAFLQKVEALKPRHGGGADFEPARLDFVPVEPFS